MTGRLAILVATAALLPALPLLLAAFGRGWFYPDLLPEPSLAAWAYAAGPVSGVLPALARTIAIALAVAALAVMIALPACLVLARRPLRGARAVEALLLAPALVPAVAVALGLHGILIRLGLAGTTAGVIVVHLVPALPYAVFLLLAILRNLGNRHEAQAATLGAGPLAAFLHVTLPLLAPGLAAAFAFSALVSWSQYALTLLVGGGRVLTLPMILAQFAAAGRLDVAAVAAILIVLPALFVVILMPGSLARPLGVRL